MTPLLPLIRELVSRGDDLVVYSTASYAAKIEQTGARYRPYRAARLDDLTRLPDKTEEISLLLMSIVGEVLDADLPGHARRASRLHRHRLGRSLGAMGRASARRPGRHLRHDVRDQSPRAGVCRLARRASQEHPADAVEARARVEGAPHAAAIVARPSRPWPRRLRHRVRSFGAEYRPYLARISAVRRDFRCVVSLRGPAARLSVRRRAADRGRNFHGRAARARSSTSPSERCSTRTQGSFATASRRSATSRCRSSCPSAPECPRQTLAGRPPT